ncbi:MAG: YwiC-like family protein [Bryobacterales bacterium]
MTERPSLIFPREHGSWGMLLFPLVSAAILAKTWTWWLIPALGAALAGFLIREPLAILLRQRYVWRQPRPETASATRSLRVFVPLLLACGATLAFVVPLRWLAALGLIGATLTGVYLYAALHKLQRSTLLQLAGSFGLTSACALPWLAAGRTIDRTLLLLAIVHAVHSTGGVLTVHARLESMQANRGKTDSRRARTAAWLWQPIQGLVALFDVQPLLTMALIIPMCVHVLDLWRFGKGESLQTPLKEVGFRELGLSAAVSVLAIAALW